MKKIVGVLGASLMTMIYCFALLAIANCQLYADAPTKSYTLEEQQSYTSNNAIHLFSHTTQTSFLVGAVHSNLFSASKNPFPSFSGILRSQEIIFRSAYYQYHHSSVNFLVRFRKSDLIFPFHYFW